MIDRGANGGIAGSDTRRSATLVALSTLLGLMITSSIHLHRFGRSGRLHPFGTRHRYPKSVRMVSSRWHFHSFIRPDGTFWQHRRRSMIVGGRQHVVTMGDYIIPIDIVNGLPYTPMRLTLTKKGGLATSPGPRTPTGIPLSSTARSVTRPTGTSLPKPPSDRPSFDRTGNYTDRTDMDPPLPLHPY
jgi:hypothetical protein